MKRVLRIFPATLGPASGLLAVLVTLSGAVAKDKYTMPTLKEQPATVSREVKAATSFAPVIKKVAPSVVNIYSTRVIKQQQMQMPFFDDPMFRRFFGDQFGGGQGHPRMRPQKAQSLGSGVIVSEDGFILTNNHVIEGADEVKVALADGKTEYTAKVVGTDPQTEIAVLKVEAKGLTAITLTDSDKLEVGDTVLAIGNPFGVGQTVTMGIVSATGRGGFGITDYEDFIQTDAAINMGNSGGPLVDVEGRLVGINTAILSRSGGNVGIGFAVPVNMAKNVMVRLVGDGEMKRGYLGVFIQPVTPELAKEFNLPDQSGALVGGVSEKTPAEEAGIKDGDVIVEFNGKKVEDSRHLRLMVAQSAPGAKVPVKLIRDGKAKTVTVTLGRLPDDQAGVQPSGRSRDQQELDALDGVEVADLEQRYRRQFDIPRTLRGALVVNVDESSNAAEAGLRPGDVILEINREPVADADTAVELTKKVKGERMLLRVWSKTGDTAGTRYVTVSNKKRKE